MRRSYHHKEGFKLFLMSVPFLAVTFIFSYLPLTGWSYAFFEYRVGLSLFDTPFVGFDNFVRMFQSRALRNDIIRVLTNTLGMSFIGLSMSWLPMFFAIILAEMRSKKFRRTIQTITTIPNFISWVLVYSFAFVMLASGEGVVNRILLNIGAIDQSIDFLTRQDGVWMFMWMLGAWKGLGWSAILYIAAMMSIDPELYEAAAVDGAGRFKRIWFITIPSLMPTFVVLFVLAISNFLNTGFEQYFLFENPMNRARIEVFDLFIYNQGMVGRQISYTTAVGVMRTFVSLILLFSANFLSKIFREEKIF